MLQRPAHRPSLQRRSVSRDIKTLRSKRNLLGPDPHLIPWHEPDEKTAYGYDPFGNRIQIGVIAKRPMHFGEISRFAARAHS
jgi:hypothetical protein